MIRLPPIPDNLQDPMPMVSPFVNLYLSPELGPKVSFRQTLNANHIRTARYIQDKLKVTSAANAIWTRFVDTEGASVIKSETLGPLDIRKQVPYNFSQSRECISYEGEIF